ncbi:MAG TPA: DUF6438 domain-containing protein [Allosphingosinicella sp.]
MRKIVLIAAVAAALAGAAHTSRAGQAPRVAVPQQDIVGQRIEGESPMRVSGAGMRGTAEYAIEIGADGRVLSARQNARPHEPPAPAAVLAAVRAWRFLPFTLDGAPITAVGAVHVEYLPGERSADPAAPFPSVDYDRLRIVLERTPCFGWCPAYRVEISGNGAVRLTTQPTGSRTNPNFRPILVPGEHVWRIPQADVEALVERFRAARFFGLDDRYAAQVSDAPDTTLVFASGRSSKSVLDRVGELVGMPDAVTALQDAVDNAAGIDRFVRGSADTAAALAARGFDFASEEATRILLAADDRAPEALYLDFLARGVPLDRPFAEENAAAMPLGRLLLERAVRRGQVRLFASLADRGWLERVPDGELGRWFVQHGSGCEEAIAEALVRAGASPRGRAGEDGWGVFHMLVRRPSFCDRRVPEEVRAFAAALVRLGADPNLRDNHGSPPLFYSQDLGHTQMLLALGARPDVAGPDGPAILWTHDDRIALTLLRAGANPRVAKEDGATLRSEAMEKGLIGTLRWLDEHRIP